MSAVWDRNKARKILDALCDDCDGETELQRALDALEGCVRPAPAQSIDRDELTIAINVAAAGGSVPVYPEDVQRYVEAVLALLRPVDGVTLTREEVRLALTWWGGFIMSGAEPLAPHRAALETLARRLEASL